jgi:predicted PurR-regulated permease PerM
MTGTTSAAHATTPSSPRDEAATWFSRGVGFVGGGLLAYGVVTGFLGASTVVLLFFFALLLASALEPIVAELRDRLPVARGAALLLVYGGCPGP